LDANRIERAAVGISNEKNVAICAKVAQFRNDTGGEGSLVGIGAQP